ncbi:MAG: O-antigen ligase family protein [Parcubacteria group bacterium]
MLGIIQFIMGHSIGLSVIGESYVSYETSGVAKIIIDGAKHIRAYGTFPHPNILAGFLLIPIFVIFGRFVSISRFREYSTNDKWLSSSWLRTEKNTTISHETNFLPKSKSVLSILLLINLAGLGVTFSRSAILGLVFGLIFYAFHVNRIKQMASIFIPTLILLITLSIPAINFLNKHSSIFSSQTLEERKVFENVSHETIYSHPLHGVGIGQFVINEYKLYPNMEGWQYQPEHNSFILIFGELGAIGFILFLLFLIYLITSSKKNMSLTDIVFYCIIISFTFILLFDHYFWDIKIGLITFALGITLSKTGLDSHFFESIS